jgi:hypothetical protein
VKKTTAENSEKQPRKRKKTMERAALDLSLHLCSPNHEPPFLSLLFWSEPIDFSFQNDVM